MRELLQIELYKIFSRPRSYISFAAISVLVSIIHLAIGVDGENYVSLFLQQIQETFQIEGKVINGNFVAWIILQTLIIQMPLLVALVTGDLVSGEAASGTLRLIATKPFTRIQWILAKFLAGSCYTFSLVLWLGMISLGAGLLLFGSGDLIVISSEQVTILRQPDTLWRFISALFIACLSLTAITSLSLLFSAYADNSIGPIVSTIAIVIIFTIIGTMEFPLFQKISPWLFTTHMVVWRELFGNPVDWNSILSSVIILLFHITIFLALTAYHFSRKDILI